MPVITLHTAISAPVEIVFDLSRSIDLHKISTNAVVKQYAENPALYKKVLPLYSGSTIGEQ